MKTKWYYYQHRYSSTVDIVGASTREGLAHLLTGSPYDVIKEIPKLEGKTFEETIEFVQGIIGNDCRALAHSYWDGIGSVKFPNPDRGEGKRPGIRKEFIPVLEARDETTD